MDPMAFNYAEPTADPGALGVWVLIMVAVALIFASIFWSGAVPVFPEGMVLPPI